MNDVTSGTVETEVVRVVTRVEAATERFVQTVAKLSAEDLAGPSLLPGWTRGHVVAHVARNANALVNLLRTAAGGEPTPMYPSVEARNADIEDGARRAPGVLLAEVADSARAWAEAVRAVPSDRWDLDVKWIGARVRPVRTVPPARLREVEFHHVDLDAGYTPAHWDPDHVAFELAEAAASLSGREGVPDVLLVATDGAPAPAASPSVDSAPPGEAGEAGEAGDTLPALPAQPSWRIAGGEGGALSVTVTGPAAALLAWVAGRSSGDGLHATAGVLPQLPAWP